MGLFSRTSPATEAWEDLALPWRSAFSLAWEAYRVRTIPVGAVLVDAGGRMLARSRNHVFGDPAPVLDGILAHAEVIALARLSPLDRHEGLALYVTLEPCSMCIGAATTATISAIHYAGADPYSGAAVCPIADTPHSRRLPLSVSGPMPGPFGLLASVLHVELFMRINPTGQVVETYKERAPGLYELANRILATDVLRASSARREGLNEALPEIWPLLND